MADRSSDGLARQSSRRSWCCSTTCMWAFVVRRNEPLETDDSSQEICYAWSCRFSRLRTTHAPSDSQADDGRVLDSTSYGSAMSLDNTSGVGHDLCADLVLATDAAVASLVKRPSPFPPSRRPAYVASIVLKSCSEMVTRLGRSR